jgi:hypothetical protein
MDWGYIAPPAGYDWLTDGLKKETNRLTKSVEVLMKRRKSADELAELESDRSADRGPLIRARLDALRIEAELRESLIILNLACEKIAGEKHRKARAVLLEVELSVRQRLHVPDRTKVPDSCLQNEPTWWDAREALAAVPQPNDQSERREHERQILTAKDLIGKLSRALAGEPGRLKRLRDAQQREENFQNSIVELEEARRAQPDDRDQLVAELLK